MSEVDTLRPDEAAASFPEIRVPLSWTYEIQVNVLAKLPTGAGLEIHEQMRSRQSKHPNFTLEYEEPSARIASTNFRHSDPTAVYTFSVEERELVFHRHEGARVILGFTGDRGAALVFSTMSLAEERQSPQYFPESVRTVEIEPNSLFVLKFDGRVAHTFRPLRPGVGPASSALSIHPDEERGLTGELRETVRSDRSSIPALTNPISTSAATAYSQRKEVGER